MLELLLPLNIVLIIIIFLISIFLLSKSADFLVDNAVKLSKILKIPEMIIGATIVSLGTTLPEFSAATISALKGNFGFALGNSIGSIITNTSLVLGVGALFGTIPVTRKASQKLSILNLAILLLILPTIPRVLRNGEGTIPQWMGGVLLVLIPFYGWYLIAQEKRSPEIEILDPEEAESHHNLFLTTLFVLGAAAFVAFCASVLVASAEIIAKRIGISDIIISATIVSFGTSVPELTTAISASKTGHGGLVIGNVMGANILNILLVTGASIALIPGGITVPNSFYLVHFPIMIAVLAIFGYFAYNKNRNEINHKEGILLTSIFGIYLLGNFIFTLM